MAVRSKCLVAPFTPSTGGANVYTCPTDETAIVKWLNCHNTTGAAADLAVAIRISSGATINFVLKRSVPANGSVEIPLWWVLHPGWVLNVAASSGTALRCAIFGAELEGVAD